MDDEDFVGLDVAGAERLNEAALRHYRRLRRGPGVGLSKSVERIVTAAWRMVERDGVEDIKIESLLRESGTSRRVFYYYFDNKAALIAMMLSHKRDKVAYDVVGGMQWTQTPLERVEAWVCSVLFGIVDPRERGFQHLIRANRSELAALPIGRSPFTDIMLGPLVAAIVDGMKRGDFAIVCDEQRLAMSIWLLCLGVLSDWRFDGPPLGDVEVRRTVLTATRAMLHVRSVRLAAEDDVLWRRIEAGLLARAS